MEAQPAICPACGELVIVLGLNAGMLYVPAHPDRVAPEQTCFASTRVIRDGAIRQD